MNRERYYLGIDLGTSSVKGILRSLSGHSIKGKQTYSGAEPQAWFDAVKALIGDLTERLDGEIAGISISSQVGTYVIDGKEVISWRSSVGKEELDEVKSKLSEDTFLREIGMVHPDLVSYPLPRYLYIQKYYGDRVEVLMPKELLLRALTGNTVTDVFSMRGIANNVTGTYSQELLQALGITLKLPQLKYPTDLAGTVTNQAAEEFGLAAGIPVYLGCNDFFAGLLGMGIYRPGDFFDLSGTSEHIGYLSEKVNRKGFVSGGYFSGNCTYGGTKASGAACDLAIHCFGIDGLDLGRLLAKKPPIFLPYLSGERAPIFDEKARGVYFGLDEKTDKEALAYATLEGVVFSLYHIATSMDAPKPQKLICGGGSARDPFMNLLRATLFDCEVVSVCENDTSALGACMIAMVGNGAVPNLSAAISACVAESQGTFPVTGQRDLLRRRFEIYRSLYGDLRSAFDKFHQI